MINENSNISTVDRKRISLSRNYSDGILMDRAERVEPFSASIMHQIKDNIDLLNLGLYHNLGSLYEKMSSYIGVKQNQMLITAGADESIKNIFNIFLKPKDTVCFPSPTYGMYHVYSNVYGVRKQELRYDNEFKINKKVLYDNIDNIKILFLPNPNHIEDLFTLDEIEKICKKIASKQGIVVVDETYNGFGSYSCIPLIKNCKNLIVVRSLSKSFGLPSLRVGVTISNKKLISIIESQRLAYEIPLLSQQVAEFFLDNIHIVNDYKDRCIEGREFLVKSLGKKYKINGLNNYLININFKNESVAKNIKQKLESKDVWVSQYDSMIRLTIGPIEYMKTFLEKFTLVSDGLT